jgi:hypothetical protein
MQILFRVRLSNEKIRQSTRMRNLESLEELTADFLTKPAVRLAFILFGLEFGKH